MRVVLSGGPSPAERAFGQAIEAAMNNPVKNLIGKDTLQELVALLRRADIVLSPDSGPAHIASAAQIAMRNDFADGVIGIGGPVPQSVAFIVGTQPVEEMLPLRSDTADFRFDRV